MKKIILGALALSMCLTLTACKNEQDSAVTSLGNQLDETANTLSNFTTVNPNDINVDKDTLDKIATNASKENMYDNLISTQHALLNEEYYKTNILDKTAKIKNNLNSDLKLSKAQISALKELTTNLQRYTTSINYSKNELNNSVKAISNMKKNAEKNADKINVKLNKLACNSNVRSTYYENIINTLNQIEGYISTNNENTVEENVNQENNNYPVCPEQNCYNNQFSENQYNIQQNNSQEQPTQQNENEQTYNSENKAPFGLTKNIDTYGPTNKNIDTYGGNDFGGLNNENIANGYGYYGYNNNYYGNGCYGMNNRMNGNYCGFGYGYNSNNYNRMNQPPMRPATFVSITLPEKRLEEFEKINQEDNTIEKVEENNTDAENLEEKTQPTALMHVSHRKTKSPDAVAHRF
ncbi:MAG: hypothetical protein K2K31_01450 [Clostridia bacterium]|nr:hypothetical protein [Clostridia bacterium]